LLVPLLVDELLGFVFYFVADTPEVSKLEIRVGAQVNVIVQILKAHRSINHAEVLQHSSNGEAHFVV
jgi:hypothetical protein